jgi:hypothetical protein
MGGFNLANLQAMRNMGGMRPAMPGGLTDPTAAMPFRPQPGPDMRPPMPVGPQPPTWGGQPPSWPLPPGGGIDPRLLNLLAMRNMYQQA